MHDKLPIRKAHTKLFIPFLQLNRRHSRNEVNALLKDKNMTASAKRLTLTTALFSVAAVAMAISAHTEPSRPLTVVELFQSEGCSDCPPAEANLNAIAGRDNILALSFEVTYWDQLGWKDRYASPAFTARQWDYAHYWHNNGVYTPQMVINGRYALVGANRGQVENAIAHTPGLSPSIKIDVRNRGLTVSSAAPLSDTILQLVTYDPRVINQPVRAGENAGATLPHKDIVTGLTTLGHYHGGNAHYTIAPAPAAMAQAVLLQQGVGGPIIAAAKI